MPIERKWHYVCPITGQDVAITENTLPNRWALIEGEVYSPLGMYVLAWRILKHSEATYEALLSTPYPSTVLDDWQDAPPVPEGWVASRL